MTTTPILEWAQSLGRPLNPTWVQLQSVRCIACQREPVKSRRNTRCLSCGAAVCRRCQGYHFTEVHER